MAMNALYAKRVALLLLILVLDHLLQANSASLIEPDPEFSTGTVVSGRRKLRKLPPPPAPKLSGAPHYMFSDPPPPPSTTQMRSTAPNLRTVPKRAPPAPKLSRPRNFRIFLSPPPPPPPPPPPAVQGRTSNCKIAPPPPA
ncbi:formin-like protein 5 isoform X1 [Lactuca sativa]|uniref:formin-like protein 5 isoform X1 n=1 Tax=Lactuca sativa TaxID=4236 RepID=UPI000CD9ABF1|nr:formin-like protein 5 isoform X1 [Lactuca sativa]